MPRRINPKCRACAADSIEVAESKDCWNTQNPQVCHVRRSYYRNQPQNKAKKRSQQRAQRLQSVDFPLLGHSVPAEAQLILYRDRADGPIHAVEFLVVEQGQVVKKVKPKHLKGVPQRQLRAHIQQVLGVLKAEFGDGMLVAETRVPVKNCPLCNLGIGDG